jgi:glycosyltransferase involved in cell wall biosynthesis
LVIDGENGFRLRDGTPKEMSDRIARILNDPLLAERMGKASRSLITGKFAFSEFIGRIKTALLKVA